MRGDARDKRARCLLANIHREFYELVRFWHALGGADGADADIKFLKIVVGNHEGARYLPRISRFSRVTNSSNSACPATSRILLSAEMIMKNAAKISAHVASAFCHSFHSPVQIS